MFNWKLRRRILELEDSLASVTSRLRIHELLHQSEVSELKNTLQKAATYHDASDYECPLCGDINIDTKIPSSYCSLHIQIAQQESTHEQIQAILRSDASERLELAQAMSEITNAHRKTIDKMILMLLEKPFKMSTKQIEMIVAMMSESELKVQSMSRSMECGDWMYVLTYIDKM